MQENAKWKDLRDILMWVLLGAVLVWGYQQMSAKIDARRSSTGSNLDAMKAKVAVTVSKGPKTSIWTTQHGDVIELQIPTSVAGVMLEYKRCFVFRDVITRTTSMSCEAQGPASDVDPDGPDYSDLR